MEVHAAHPHYSSFVPADNLVPLPSLRFPANDELDGPLLLEPVRPDVDRPLGTNPVDLTLEAARPHRNEARHAVRGSDPLAVEDDRVRFARLHRFEVAQILGDQMP